MHLVIDGYRGDEAKMWDKQRLETFLLELPATLGMTRVTEPAILNYDAPKPEDSGISGFVIIAESHISVHTFPRKSYVNIDIFSCQSFDKDAAFGAGQIPFRPGRSADLGIGPGPGMVGRPGGRIGNPAPEVRVGERTCRSLTRAKSPRSRLTFWPLTMTKAGWTRQGWS